MPDTKQPESANVRGVGMWSARGRVYEWVSAWANVLVSGQTSVRESESVPITPQTRKSLYAVRPGLVHGLSWARHAWQTTDDTDTHAESDTGNADDAGGTL